jgi:hypothetical protein
MKKILVLFAFAILAGCATGPPVYWEHVEGKTIGTVTIRTSTDLLGNVEVISFKVIFGGVPRHYALQVEYSGDRWRLMEGPIKLIYGGLAWALKTTYSWSVDQTGVHETLLAEWPLENFEQMYLNVIQIQYWGEPTKLTNQELRMMSEVASYPRE